MESLTIESESMDKSNENEVQAEDEEDQDIIERYDDREIGRIIANTLGKMKPDALRQIIKTSNFLPMEDFQIYVNQLIEKYCTLFIERLNEWRPRVGHSEDYLTAMIYYHQKWEGFRSSEPWADSENRKISFFFDVNYHKRVREMNEYFVTDSQNPFPDDW